MNNPTPFTRVTRLILIEPRHLRDAHDTVQNPLNLAIRDQLDRDFVCRIHSEEFEIFALGEDFPVYKQNLSAELLAIDDEFELDMHDAHTRHKQFQFTLPNRFWFHP